MRHLKGYRKLGLESSHRRAMLRNLATSFLEGGKVDTTVPRAKEVRRIVEKLITLGKRGDLHARRLAGSYVFGRTALSRLFDDYGKRFETRPGGYTRIVKLGTRFGDGASLCRLELVDYEIKLAEAAKSES